MKTSNPAETVPLATKASATKTSATKASATKATFLYDDCCPLCRGYTATFSALGWADRQAFSTIDDATFASLDFDRARHHIPLHDGATGETKYGLDGILGVVAAQAPVLKPVVEHEHVRQLLAHVYWFITYNRRHIVTAAPPASGIDCAPDFERAPVQAYLAFCAVAATGCAVAAGTAVPVGAATAAASALATSRDRSWEINNYQAAGHVGSVAVAAGVAGFVAKAVTKKHPIAITATVVVAARKLYLRRWMRTTREPVTALR